ncbi:3-deoxy-D-manno-octulosonic acid transferase [Ottowia sp. GY511]|uniref:3-deoxy-D-manno-octulosonic acid transferase n=1 Tax=Ottowia flava TaxID=2675430 RepID=A0ABW4KSN9_9BURK|nr:3-deoxy-D-manno-octulosonic acid transferase [Ottowia sp. GY511]TXK26477.1 3-deoxy-D-manno-octulosonic acid transferase [Ottowia sp. GY511]
MVRTLYSALMWAAQPLLRRKLRRRGAAEPGYLEAVDERFGHYTVARPDADATAGRPLVWIHAVSLGETRAAAILLKALRQRLPGMRLLLTHGTATGRAEGRALLQPGDAQVWQPWDTRGAVRGFLRHFRPDVGVLMETEIWPNLNAECATQGVPLALANARLSAKSLRGAERAGWLMRPAYAALRAVWAQTEADADRLRRAGARQVTVLGNLKFDATPDPAQLAQGRAWRNLLGRPVVMLASAREGEETLFLECIRSPAPQPPAQAATKSGVEAGVQDRVSSAVPAGAAPAPLWLIVPRHPQRFDEVAALATAQGWRVARRSAWGDTPPADAAQADVWIGDSLGEMALYYSLADVALLGGSFAPLGGQNLIEAAACGCPVLMGPHTFNFAQAGELAEAAGAARRVPDMAAGVAAACDLLADNAARNAMQDAGVAFAAAHRGAAARTAEAVGALLAPAAK